MLRLTPEKQLSTVVSPKDLSPGGIAIHKLAAAAKITTIGTAIPYYFIGPALDSMRADSDENVYVAMYGQGRVLVFNKNGIPIGQVLLPGRDEGHNLQSTSMAPSPARTICR